jgi:hypothetical protein
MSETSSSARSSSPPRRSRSSFTTEPSLCSTSTAPRISSCAVSMETLSARSTPKTFRMRRTMALTRLDSGPTTSTKRRIDRGDGEREAIRIGDGPGFRQHLGEDHQRQCHGDGRIGDAALAEQGQEHAGRQRRTENVDEVVADQQRADQPVLAGQQRVDVFRARIARAFQRVHARPRCRGQRGLGARKEGRHDDEEQHDSGDDPDFHLYAPIFSARKERTSASGTSFAMKDWPMPCVRMKLSAPRVTFLSCRM